MTTLIAVYDSSGCVGRCDAKCYDAKNADCDCICSGRNHSAGLEKAVENTRQQVEDWITEYTKSKGLENCHAIINRPLVDQLQLFDTANLSKLVS